MVNPNGNSALNFCNWLNQYPARLHRWHIQYITSLSLILSHVLQILNIFKLLCVTIFFSSLSRGPVTKISPSSLTVKGKGAPLSFCSSLYSASGSLARTYNTNTPSLIIKCCIINRTVVSIITQYSIDI